jgi:hypothetical protein
MSSNLVKYGSGVSVTASNVDKAVSKTFAPKDPWNIQAVVVLSAVSQTNAIAFTLKDSFDGETFYAVGSESSVSVVKKTFAGDTAVNPTNEQITITSHGFLTGDRVVLHANGATLPTGLANGTYYVIKVDENTLTLAATQEDAIAGTSVGITADGTGTCALYQAAYQIRMERDDSSDRAQLPLWDSVQVVANSGASDTCTVSAVYVSGF